MINYNGSASRMADALAHAETFTRAQVADLLQRAFASEWPPELIWQRGYEAGYWARVAEENAAYPPEPYVVVAGVTVRRDQEAARDVADTDRTQRYAGGPVPVWLPDRKDLPDLGPSAATWQSGVGVPVRRLADGTWTWAEQ